MASMIDTSPNFMTDLDTDTLRMVSDSDKDSEDGSGYDSEGY